MSVVSPRKNGNKQVQVHLFCTKCGAPLTYAKDTTKYNHIIYMCTRIGCGFRKQPLPLNEHILDVKRKCGSWDTTVSLYDRYHGLDYK